MPANSQTCREGSWNDKAFKNGYRQKEHWLSVMLAWVRKAWEESSRITQTGNKNVLKMQPGEGVCALSDFKVPLLPKGALVSCCERDRDARLCTQDKTNTSPEPAWKGGKVLAGCPAGIAAKCPVPFRWHGLVCFEYYSSKFLNFGNLPNPSLELLVEIWGQAVPCEDPRL